MKASSDILEYRLTRPTEGGASYSLRHRVFRVLWAIVWFVLASWTPAPLHRWRVFLIRWFGGDVHPTAHVYSSAKIWYPANLTMGPHACLGPQVNCYNMAMITLDDHAIVSQGAHLCCGTHDVDDAHFQLIARPITIEAGAWVAAESFVGPGVTVGSRSVVGARAVCFKNTEPNFIYVGNPAVKLRERRG